MKIITGMHRSGTSLVAQLFHAVGADMGDEKTFYRPDRWNPDGYFEQPDIHAINFPLIYGPFWKFSYFLLPSEKTILKRAHAYSNQIASMAEKYQGKVVKETRFSLTWPAWINHGAKIDKVIVCLREPIQVALSIKKRNWTPVGHGFYLWREHNERLLKYIQNIPHYFVSYESLLNKNSVVQELRGLLGFFGFNKSPEECQVLAQNHIKTYLNHNTVLPPSYPKEVQALWEELRSRYAKQFSGTNL